MKKKDTIALIGGTVIALTVGGVALFLSDEKRRRQAQAKLKELWGKAETTVKKAAKKIQKKKKK
jgi:hypothetical protein